MRSVLVLVAILAIGYSTELKFGHQFNGENLLPKNVKLFEDTINETLECVRYNLENGLPEYNFSSIETLFVEDFVINVDNLNISGASGYAHVRDLSFSGLTTFVAPEIEGKLSLSPMGYDLDITVVFQDFDLNTLYDLDMIVDDMHVHGDGDLKWSMKDLSLKISVFIAIGDVINIQDLSILINIGSSHAEITGWFNDEEHSQIFTDLFNDYLVPAWVNQQPEDIDATISPILQELINSMLATPSTKLELPEGFVDALMNCDVTPTEESAY